MSNTITIAPVIVNVLGTKSAERKMSVATQASNASLLAMISAKGDVGKYARQQSAGAGLMSISKAACNANFRPVAEYLAMQLGEPMVISGRAAFESLPDQFEQRILKECGKKNGGYKLDAKTGAEVPTPAHALYKQLRDECRSIINAVAAYHEERKAKEEAKDTVMASITQG